MAEIITKDCKEYHIWDKVNGVWNRLFFKTNAKSVDADDGKDLQTKVGAINGISSSSTATDENIAASIGYVNQELTELNTNLDELTDSGNVQSFTVGEDGSPYITYKVGADSVTKKLSSGVQLYSAVLVPGTTTQTSPCDGYVMGFGNYTTASAGSSMNMLINNVTPSDLQSVNGGSSTTGYKYMMASCKKGDTVKLSGAGSTNGLVFFAS